MRKGTESATTPNLEQAIARAIEEGEKAAAELKGRFEAIRVELGDAMEAIRPWASASAGAKSAGGAASAFCDLLDTRSEDIQGLFRRQRASLKTVNLAFFGRTGVGKSSLIEALTHGDGESVSTGESDWTVDVRPLEWRGCRLVDTPGINGWGRTQDRSALERNARRAVEVADLVVLCFDSQSQQEAEFAKVSEWVHAYGKPVVAILNCRNQHWRFPPREELASQRRSQSQAVHQHEGNIRDGLASLGVHEIPIVSLSAKRALIARGQEPFKGPDAKTFVKQRREHGPELLLKWSNLPAFESLVVEALERDAAGIRLGMLVAQLRGVLRGLDGELSRISEEGKELAEVLDKAVDTLLRVLGYPTEAAARAVFEDPRLQVNLLERAEQLRGGPFQAPEEGEFQTFATQMLSAHLGHLRSKAHEKADEVILRAFERRKPIDGKAFAEEVYNRRAMDAAAREVLEQAAKFLNRKGADLLGRRSCRVNTGA